jgi:hypothetical protein
MTSANVKRGKMERDIWTYSDEAIGDVDLTGYSVEAVDGGIGKIDEATYDIGGSHVVVDTGPWILGKKVLLPAGVITRIDPESETAYVRASKDEIKNSPEYDKDVVVDDSYRTRVGGYYSGTETYRGSRL